MWCWWLQPSAWPVVLTIVIIFVSSGRTLLIGCSLDILYHTSPELQPTTRSNTPSRCSGCTSTDSNKDIHRFRRVWSFRGIQTFLGRIWPILRQVFNLSQWYGDNIFYRVGWYHELNKHVIEDLDWIEKEVTIVCFSVWCFLIGIVGCNHYCCYILRRAQRGAYAVF
jgi:hypothetical protein